MSELLKSTRFTITKVNRDEDEYDKNNPFKNDKNNGTVISKEYKVQCPYCESISYWTVGVNFPNKEIDTTFCPECSAEFIPPWSNL